MQIASLHNGVLKQSVYGIRAHRLSQAAEVGVNVPRGLVIADAGEAARDMDVLKASLRGLINIGKLYALRASPGKGIGGGHTR